MPRRSILSATERESLLALPDTQDELIRRYTLSDSDLSIVRQRRGAANRLGFAVQLGYMRYPGIVLGRGELPFSPMLHLVAKQLKIPVEKWAEYGDRAQTRREHMVELQTLFGFRSFTTSHHRAAVQDLMETALQTDTGIVLASTVVEKLRTKAILLPRLNAIERICAEAVTRANRHVYRVLTDALSGDQCARLDDLLKRREGGSITSLAWLRQSFLKPNSRHMLEHIDRLRALRALDLPAGIERQIHQNRLLKIAREGGQMTAADLMKFEPQRRYATLVALVVEGTATVTDEIIDLHDRIVGKLFNAAKNKHQEQFQSAGKAINDKIRLYGQIGQALLEAKQNGGDPFVAIEAVISWDDFAMHAAPAAKPVLGAINLLREMNASNARKLPEDAPTEFVRRRWDKLVLTEDGIDRRYYELCAMSELKNALRSGDIWVEGSRQFKNFNEYLLPAGKFTALKLAKELPLAIDTECESYLHARLSLLDSSGCRKVSAARHDCTSWPQSLGREARLHRLATKSRPRGTTARVGHKV